MTTIRVTPRWRQLTPLLALAALALAVLAACGDSGDEAATTTTTMKPSVTSVPGTRGAGASTALKADLAGTVEVPGPGDPSATGTAVIALDPAKSEVCWEITVVGLEPEADKAHIHRGTAGQAGAVVVTLTPPTGGSSNGCAAADPALMTELTNSPQGFYVNLHNTPYPNGAVRGQLGKAG